MNTDAELVIASRFCGPPTSGNGGYTCGRLATLLGGPVEVTLRKPPALDRPLRAEATGQRLSLHDGELLVAEARRVPASELDVPMPSPPTFAEATDASRTYPGFERHAFATCFVCGPARAPGDGLRIFPGRLPGHAGDVVAAPFVPDASLDDGTGFVRPEFLWASLDCPGFWAASTHELAVALLGRMTADVEPVKVGTPCVVVGWGLGSEGRKIFAATALFDERGVSRGRARQVWIKI